MRAYSEDLRQRIVGAVAEGLRPVEAAEIFKVSLATVKRYVKQKREQGHLHFEQPPGRPRKLSVRDEQILLEQVKNQAEASLEEHAVLLNEETGQDVSAMTVQRSFTRLGITRKKRQNKPVNVSDVPGSSGGD